MQQKQILYAAAAVGAFLFWRSQQMAKRSSGQGATQAAIRTGGTSAYVQSPATQINRAAEVQAYTGLGQMLGSIYGKVYGNMGGNGTGASGGGGGPINFPPMPDDSMAINPPATLGDAYSYIAQGFGTGA
jgi:hypothetical protein